MLGICLTVEPRTGCMRCRLIVDIGRCRSFLATEAANERKGKKEYGKKKNTHTTRERENDWYIITLLTVFMT